MLPIFPKFSQMYGIVVTERCLTIEVKLTSIATQLPFAFPDNQIIRQKSVMVYGIETFTSTQASKSPAGNDLVNDNGAKGLILNFLDNTSVNLVNQLPYYSLVTQANSGIIREFKPFECVLQKSFVTIVDTTNLTANQSILINLIYKPTK